MGCSKEPSNNDVWEDDFESDWATVTKEPLIKVIRNKASDLREQLEVACQQTAFELKTYHVKNGEPLTSELLSKVISKGVQIFMEKWYVGLRQQNISGLIEIVLEGQDLTPAEMKGFVQALPLSLLEKVAQSPVGTISGTHGLIAVEHALRKKNITDYKLGKENGRTYIEFTDPKREVLVKFFIDDTFAQEE